MLQIAVYVRHFADFYPQCTVIISSSDFGQDLVIDSYELENPDYEYIRGELKIRMDAYNHIHCLS